MAEITYRSPGFFESEIDLSIAAPAGITATPAGVIGTSPIGPAFLPTTVGSLAEFREKFFGSTAQYNETYYAAQEFFRYGQALTFVRSLGAGVNSTAADISLTSGQGTAKGAGFVIKSPSNAADGRAIGCVQILAAKHVVTTDTADAYPIFANNNSTNVTLGAGGNVNLVRGVLLFPTGTRGHVMNYSEAYSPSNVADDAASIQADPALDAYKSFKIVVSSSAPDFGTADGYTGIKIYTASLDPNDQNYIAKVLNTSPELFEEKQHLLYLDYSVEAELATVAADTGAVAILSGTSATSATSGNSSLAFLDAFGRFDARYAPSRTTTFISQLYGTKVYDLFHFETLSDGASANNQFKVSIANLRRSTDDRNPYGTFDVLIRDFNDTDVSPVILERYGNCTLNPQAADYVAKKIGDKKVYYNFDTVNPVDRNFTSSGRYPRVSTRVRIVMSQDVEQGSVPASALPFGFHGMPTLKTNDGLTDTSLPTFSRRLGGILPAVGTIPSLTSSITPPVPLRYKVTSNATDATPSFQGEAGPTETADARLYWGVKYESFPSVSGTLGASAYLQPNESSKINPLIYTLSRFAGIEKLDMLMSGSGADNLNNNRFSLNNVALYNSKGTSTALAAAVANLTGTLDQHMINAIYIRNATPDVNDYTISDTAISGRLTLGTLALIPSSSIFNRFSPYIKFTNMFYGGFDGLNILDKDMAAMNDRSTSSETGGKAIASPNIGLNIAANNFGSGDSNALVSAYKTSINIMTNAGVSRANIITIPGIREPAITNYAAISTKNYARAIYLMDIPAYTDTGTRIYSQNVLPDVTYTINQFAGRNINNNYVATYFPDASIVDDSTGAANKRVRVPSSIVALGALAQNDSKSYPWYAPAGFNRTSLTSVVNLAVRLTSTDRDTLYDARINPITSFPGLGYVIFGQKTLQIARSALDRVNVRRLLIELARVVTEVGVQFVFEPNTTATRSRFVSLLTPRFATVQSQSGIDSFKIVMDESNNTPTDIEANKLNGRIIIVPTKAVEYIAIDFIITNEGVQFV